MKGADYLLYCLKKEGVDTIFGYPGGAVIPLFDALYRDGTFDIIRTCHEQGASHAADGYARRSGKVGVCVVTSGPGVTNTITGIATAYLDSSPMVLISGQVGSSFLGKNSFQEVDTTGITMPITKHNILVTRGEDLGKKVQEAFYVARSGRPGPVVLDISKDVFEEKMDMVEYSSMGREKDFRHLNYRKEIKEICKLIRESKNPVIYAGGGIVKSNSEKEFRSLVEKLNIPVANSIMGMGVIDMKDRLSLGMVGMHGEYETNKIVYESDLLIGIGVKFSDRAIGSREGFTRDAKIVHIDVDETEFNKNIDVDIKVVGDFREIFRLLSVEMDGYRNNFKFEDSLKKEESPLPRKYIESLQSSLPKETVVVTDVGQHQMWTMMYWKARDTRQILTSGGLGTMGFGVGAALGAKKADRETPIVLITGDGSFRMNHNEVLTLTKYNLPILIVIFNNKTLGMVRQWQSLFENGRYSETDIDDGMSMEYLSMAYGAKYLGMARDEAELGQLIQSIDLNSGVHIVECLLDKDEGVYPIVPVGKRIVDSILR